MSWLAFAGAALSAVSNFIGQDEANDTNTAIAAQNNATSIELANTAYQRRVADLKAAGLNPMLAYQQGGAQVPPLQQARVENSAAAASQGMLAGATRELLQAQTEKERSQTMLNTAVATKTTEEAKSAAADAIVRQIDAQAKVFADSVDSGSPGYGRAETNRLSAANAKSMFEHLQASNDYNAVGFLNDLARQSGFANFKVAVESVDFRQQLVNLANSRTQGTLLGLKVPQGQAMADMWKSSYGKNVAPYVNSAKDVVDMGTSVFPPSRFLKGH